MKSYLKLVNFEINRFLKLYVALAAFTVIVQTAVVIIHARSYLATAKDAVTKDMIPRETFLSDYGPMSIVRAMDGWFQLPIAICIAVLLIYCFMIWYRDWFGKNTFIYRLLMLPTNRIHIYLAKATAIFFMVLGLVSLELLLLPAESKLVELMVPIDYREDYSLNGIMEAFGDLNILFPKTITEFLIHYGIGLMMVFILFTSILIERCYRLKGILYGGIYFAFALVIFLLPNIVLIFAHTNYLYPVEMFFVELLLGILVTAMSIGLSHYLLNKKIRV
ncbi:hypothetical protein P5G51_018105 [Virgibacillus sp. 179-BFC.A HS]|uniref:ABC-2 family transporter protein n=1 Tax=Tigheibacillus jepli TaxID=3035914 RepID=A0ABU5CKV5_9BACI|nr:hypothetical protein [Virgibacillus sp. 179-BFC.A HS]MDY0406997.1 hypothetical protein [Virgibacillus sp. 179-BFC.A HS]